MCSRFSNLMCASLCTADEMCNAYRYNAISGCMLGNATQLVGATKLAQNTIYVYINAALVPGISEFLSYITRHVETTSVTLLK